MYHVFRAKLLILLGSVGLITRRSKVAWEMSPEEQEALNDHLNSSKDPREAFAKLINCELSFESESTINALENEVFSKEYLEENQPLVPYFIECYHFENSDEEKRWYEC